MVEMKILLLCKTFDAYQLKVLSYQVLGKTLIIHFKEVMPVVRLLRRMTKLSKENILANLLESKIIVKMHTGDPVHLYWEMPMNIVGTWQKYFQGYMKNNFRNSNKQ